MLKFRKKPKAGLTEPMPPAIIFQADGDTIRVAANWPAGENLALFAHMIYELQSGGLVSEIDDAIQMAGQRLEDTQGADLARGHILRHLNRDFNEPVVCPTQVMARLGGVDHGD